MAINDYIARWKLDETSGTNAADETTTYNGTYVNSPTLGVTGAYSGSTGVTFASASSQYVAGGSSTLLKNVAACSLSCWAKWTDATADMLLIRINGNTGATRSSLTANAGGTGKLRSFARAGDAESTQQKNHTGTALNDGAWHHIVTVINYAADTIDFYVDGVLASSSGTISFTATATSNTDSASYAIAAAYSPASNFFNGALDDVRVYDRALSATEVNELYHFYFPMYHGNRPRRQMRNRALLRM